MTDFIIIVVLALILGGAIAYIVKAKKSGAKCIGCPMSKQCGSKNQEGTGCSCGTHSENK